MTLHPGGELGIGELELESHHIDFEDDSEWWGGLYHSNAVDP